MSSVLSVNLAHLRPNPDTREATGVIGERWTIGEAELQVTVVQRLRHGVTLAQVFRAITREPELLPSILAADELPEEIEELARATGQ